MSASPAAAQVDAAPPEPRALSLGVLDPILGFRFRRIQNHLASAFAVRVAKDALRPGSFSALALIEANPGLSQRELAEEAGLDKATLVFILDDMERREWAERRRDAKDRRRHALHITAKGRKALERMIGKAVANEEAVHSALTDDESKVLLGLLDKIYRRCLVATA